MNPEKELSIYCENKNILLSTIIEITSKCNLNCLHCYVDEKAKYMSFKEISEIEKKLKEEGCLYVAITGGEALSHPNFNEIYELFKKDGFIVNIKTNSLLLNEKHITLFKKYPPSKLDITVYGLNNEEYFRYTGDKNGFSKLEKSLKLLKDNNIRFSITTIADKIHYPRIINNDYTKFFNKYGKKFYCSYDLYNTNEENMNPINLRINNEQIIEVENKMLNFNEIEKNDINKKNKLSCKGGLLSIAIDSNGNASICLMDNKKIKLNANKWDNIKKWLKNRNLEIQEMYKKSKCFKCEESFLCQQCPLWHKRTIDTQVRCELAQIRKKALNNYI